MNKRQKLVPQFDKDGDGRLNTEERQAAREFVQKQGKGKGGFGGKGGPKGPPGGFLAKPFMEAVDTDKDGNVTKAELLAGVKKFFADTDKDKNNSLNESQLSDALNNVFPPPPGFPGGGFKDGKKDGPKDGKGGFKGPPGGGGGFFFGPGNLLAAGIRERADADKNGKITLAELEKAAEKLFTELDKVKKDKLDEAGVIAGISHFSPAPGSAPAAVSARRSAKAEKQSPGPRSAPPTSRTIPITSSTTPRFFAPSLLNSRTRKTGKPSSPISITPTSKCRPRSSSMARSIRTSVSDFAATRRTSWLRRASSTRST